MSAANLPSIDPLPQSLERAFLQIRARRKARKYAGIAGIIAAGGVALAAVLEQLLPGLTGPATYLLLAAWPIMIAVYAIARVLAPLDAEPMPSMKAFERWVSLPHGEYESLFYPMAAISLLAPFSLHFIGYALFAHRDIGFPAAFDHWIALAGLISLPAQGALIVLCHRFALAKTEALGVLADEGPQDVGHPGEAGSRSRDDGATLHALFFTGMLAAIPGAMFFVLPPLAIAMLTGLFFLPPMFGYFSAAHFRERMTLDRVESIGVRSADDEAFQRARELILSRGSPATARAGALRFLVRRFERDRIGEVIDAAIRSEDPLVFRTAVIAALDIRHLPKVRDVEALARRATGSTAVSVAHLLGHYGSPLAQRTLLFLLHHGSPDVRIAAVGSLGKVGNLEAVADLRRIAVRHLSERGLDRAVDDAVKRIQERCATGPAGALALAEVNPAEGRVSTIDP